MKLTVLNDNAPGKNCLAEFGLSFLIEADKKILFDTGSSDIFLQNAQRLNISLDDLDAVVLSHGHWDHGNGLAHVKPNALICHPAVFTKRFNRKDQRYIGLNLSLEEVKGRFDLHTTSSPYYISKQIVFLGEIPRLNDFEKTPEHFTDANGIPDHIPDDSALAVKTNKGLVVVSGCAHSGICNTIEYAMKITGETKVLAVIGGFHLKADNEQMHKTVDYFKNLGIPQIHPSHCTALPALARFYDAFKINQVLTGDYFYF